MLRAIQGLGFVEDIIATMVRNRQIADQLMLHGRYPIIEHFDKFGRLKDTYSIKNGITNEGKNYLFDVMFNGATQTASGSWVISLIDNTSFSAISATDTMASHAGWLEFTGYSQSARVPWGQGASSGQTVTNGTPAVFDISANGNLQGILITTVGTKGGTTGKLWSTGLFSSVVPASIGDQLKLSYAVGS